MTIIYTKEAIILSKEDHSLADCQDKFAFCTEQKNFDSIDDLSSHLQQHHYFPSNTTNLLQSLSWDYAILETAQKSIRPIKLDIFNSKGCIMYWQDNKYLLTFEFGTYKLWVQTKNLGQRAILLSKDEAQQLENQGKAFAMELVNDLNQYRSDVYMQSKFDNRHVL